MSGVLHPVGPEPASTYWLRRSLVIGVLVVVVAVIVALATRGSDPQQSVPAVPASTSSASVTPPPGDVSPAPSSAATGPTAKASPRTTLSPTPAPTTLRPKARKTTAAPPPATSSTPRSRSSSELCDPASLRLTLTGKQQLKAKTPVAFTLSLTNTSATECSVSVNAENFELTISSGKDKIWSTSDCSTAVKSVDRTVASQSAAEWRLTWNGRRSVPGCTNGAVTLKPGTYVARAQTENVKASLRMTLVA